MKKFVVIVSTMVLVAPAVLFANTALTQSQVDSILGLLRSFGADQSIINNVSVALSGSTEAQLCYSFNANLRIGDTGEGVSELQSVLKAEGFSVGSAGVFDETTALAVVGFQEKYQSDILTPYNLQNGTGFVGVTTRTKLNALRRCGMPIQRIEPVTPQPSQNSITVLSPNGGETWQKGMTQTIKWQDNRPTPTCTTNLTGTSPTCVSLSPRMYDIKLVTYQPPCTGTACPAYAIAPYTIAKNVSGNSYNWGVGKLADLYDGLAQDGSYRIWICASASDVCDLSDSYFKIISNRVGNHAPEIVSASAYAGDIQVGQTVSFGWTAKDADNDDLGWSVDWGDGQGSGSASTACTQSGKGWSFSTSHSWSKAGTYKVVVTVKDCAGATASSVTNVTVGSTYQGQITVLSPNGGETWELGKTYTTSWKSFNISTVMVDLIRPGYECHLTSDDITNTGSLTFTLSSCVNGLTISQGSDYKVRVMNRSNAAVVVQDESDNYFTITDSGRKRSPCGTLGDVNNDGWVTQGDHDYAREGILGLRILTAEETKRADVNGSGTVNILDLTFMTRYLNGLDDTFPGCSNTSSTSTQ